jgi:uncharacterized protein YyaL (SSP411 family)
MSSFPQLMSNRLEKESSLYLRQHAENPVNWYPWGEEAFAASREQDKPLLVSIGYSACHWCHVMAHESFEDSYVADIMNNHFICVKVDREERPDIDHVYVEAVQMFNQSAGWPLNVFCLPDGKPFWGGTYFPPEDRGQGIVPWPQLLMRIADHYKRTKDEMVENAENVVKNLVHANDAQSSGGDEWNHGLLLEAARVLCGSHDDEHGGFTPAPKFPSPMKMDFLLALRESHACSQTSGLGERIDAVAHKTLSAMGRGGLFDQVGGGFARYSVDAEWKIPHFEKMLYDNALLLATYARTMRRQPDPLFAAVAEETVAWLRQDMLSPEGGFYSSRDADSEGEEGKHYAWTPKQVKEILGEEDGATFCEAYDVTTEGNFEHGASNPVLTADFEQRQVLAPLRTKLLEARSERPAPSRDEKQVTAWNALLIRGLAEAGFAFGRKEWLTLARETADWAWDNLRHEDGTLHAVRYPGKNAAGPGFLDDYAFLAEAILTLASFVDWIEPGASSTYQARAIELAEIALARFRDPKLPGFFFTADDQEAPAQARKKLWYDNALPSGNSSLLRVFASLHQLTGEQRWFREFLEARAGYPNLARRVPQGIGHALAALAEQAIGITVIKIKDGPVEPLVETLRQKPYRLVHLRVTEDPEQPTGYQLCVGTECKQPSEDVLEITRLLYGEEEG